MVSRIRAAWRAISGRATYAAAKSPRTSGGWNPAEADLNTILRSDGKTIRSRARALARDVPHVARAVDAAVDFIVGTGIELTPAVVSPTGEPMKAVNQRIADRWERFEDHADIGGRLHWREMQQAARRSEFEAGEGLVVMRPQLGTGAPVPLQLQLVEPDRLTSTYGRKPNSGSEIDQGILYDTDTGKALAYLIDGTAPGQFSTWPADQVLHPYRVLRPDQLRGVSPLAPAVMLAHAMRDYLETELDGARMASKWVAFVQTPDAEATTRGRGVTRDDDEETPTRLVEEVGNAMVDYLLPGETVDFADAKRPADAFTLFMQFCLRSFAVVAGLSYEIVSGDYSGINYSTLRGIRNDVAKSTGVQQGRFVRQFVRPSYTNWMDHEVLTGGLHLPGYWNNPARYQRATWQGPGMPQVDPAKEGKADADQVANLLKSPQEAIRARGAKPEQVLQETADYYAAAREKGLTPAWAAQAAQPSTQQAQTTEEGAANA